MPALQPEFAAHLRDGAHPAPPLSPSLPEAIAGTARRVAVHVNNRRAALCEALRANHPVVAALVGAAFFDAMAMQFIDAHPPRSPALVHYGEALPSFIERFEPAATLPYLADVARLEGAWRASYHSAEATPLPWRALADAAPPRLLESRVELHPSLRLVESSWPIVSLWRAHQSVHASRGVGHDGAECALLLRPDARVRVQRIDGIDAALLRRLVAGDPLEAAAARAPDRLARLLPRLISSGAIVRFVPTEEPS